ncbi:MAG: lytic murein transglycosylase B [Pseudomonadota bacterium]|nr:MAG: lytic murein transglycosylase B [Pseudomonadota bacterium]
MCLVVAAPAAAVVISDYPEIDNFIVEMSDRHGFSRDRLVRLFERAQIKTDIIEAIERPAEARPWYEYKERFVNPQHVAQGLRFWRKHANTLERAEAQFGVPPAIIVSLIGVETFYGKNRGRYRVIDALTTLMLRYPPRAAFFRRELEEYLLLVAELAEPPLKLKGSYAGAIGIPQFIPSSYRRYAIDFDGDGRRDLIDNPADAIGSVANFLARHGWRPRVPVSDAARIEGTRHFWVEQLGIKPALTLQQLVSYGVFAEGERDDSLSAALISLEGADGPLYRIGYNNFYVITRYNRSKRYAMAVYELSELLRDAYERP